MPVRHGARSRIQATFDSFQAAGAWKSDWATLGRWVSQTLDRLFQTEDHHAGVRSFLEKREPRFVRR